MEILRGMEVKITGVIHRLIFFLKKLIFFFIFIFFLGGGGHICANYWGGGGTAPRAPPPIPTALSKPYLQPWFYILGAQKNSLIETALLSTHKIYIG